MNGAKQVQEESDLFKFFMDYLKTKRTAMGEDNDAETDNDNDEPHDAEIGDDSTNEKPDLPLHVNNAVQVSH